MAYPDSKEEELSDNQKEEIKEEIWSSNRDSEEIAERFKEVSSSQVAGIKASLSRQGELENNKEGEEVLKTIISDYEQFYNSPRRSNEEYKWRNVRNFQKAWNEAKDKPGEEFYEVLKPVFQETNLLGWGKTTLQRKFNDEPEEASEVIKNLFDESEDIYERVSRFKEFFDQPNAGGTKVASYFLSSLYPERYIYFKFTEDQEFVEDLGLELEKSWKGYEDRTHKYLDFNNKMKEVLEEINFEDNRDTTDYEEQKGPIRIVEVSDLDSRIQDLVKERIAG